MANKDAYSGNKPQEAAGPQGQVLLITVPDGHVAGQPVGFTGPDGAQLTAQVPADKKPGDTFEIHLPPVVTLTVPEGAKAGDKLAFPGPGGEQMVAIVPEGKKVGDQFQVPLVMAPPAPMVCLTVPQGASAGQLLQFPGPDGAMLQTAIPEGLKPGDQFQVPVMMPPPAIEFTVPEGAKPGDAVSFKMPDGSIMRCVVPQGKNAGDTFLLAPGTGSSGPPPYDAKVPEGAKAGDEMETVAPDGSKRKIKVPDGLKAGDTFQVDFVKEHFDLGQLCAAVSGGELSLVQKWVAAGVSVNGRFDCGFTPLVYAGMEGNLPIIKWLIEQKADPAILTDDGRTALHLACRNGHVESAKFLLVDAKSPADAKDVMGRTPLGYALEKKQTAVADMLKGQGCK